MSASLPSSLIATLSRLGVIAADQPGHQLEGIIDAGPMVVSVMDKDNRYLYVNRAWVRTFGCSDRHVTARSVFELFPEPVAGEIAVSIVVSIPTGSARLRPSSSVRCAIWPGWSAS